MTGPKLADVPTPISSPCTSANCHMFAVWLASARPRASITVPMATGTTMPNLSDSQPMTGPPTTAPTITAV